VGCSEAVKDIVKRSSYHRLLINVKFVNSSTEQAYRDCQSLIHVFIKIQSEEKNVAVIQELIDTFHAFINEYQDQRWWCICKHKYFRAKINLKLWWIRWCFGCCGCGRIE
jgi:heme oxygenase